MAKLLDSILTIIKESDENNKRWHSSVKMCPRQRWRQKRQAEMRRSFVRSPMVLWGETPFVSMPGTFINGLLLRSHISRGICVCALLTFGIWHAHQSQHGARTHTHTHWRPQPTLALAEANGRGHRLPWKLREFRGSNLAACMSPSISSKAVAPQGTDNYYTTLIYSDGSINYTYIYIWAVIQR